MPDTEPKPIDLLTYQPRVVPSTRQRVEPELEPSWQAWRSDPSPTNTGALLKQVQPIIDSAVRPLGESAALRGRAKQLAIQSFSSYDPTRASLRTHLHTQLQGLRRIAGQQQAPIHVPERVVLDGLRMRQAITNLTDELGREPSDVELADHTGLSVRRLTQLRRQGGRPMAESAAMWVDDEGNENAPGVVNDTPDEILQEYLYYELSPRDQQMVDWTLGRNGQSQLSGREIAQRLGVSPGAVSQRLGAIQRRYNQLRDMHLFGN